MTADYSPGTQHHICGHDFTWTEEHPDPKVLERLLCTYDELANDALDRLDAISPPKARDATKCPMAQRDLFALLEEHSGSDEILGRLWAEVTTVPDWVDWEQIRRGQKVVYRYKAQMFMGLLFNSLVGGVSAHRVAETLARTGGFGARVVRRRLLETAQHFLEVIESLDSVKPGGRGFVSSVRVRLLHAGVRRRMMNLEKRQPGYYSSEEWGVPINDLHQIATVHAYSTQLAYLSLPRQGISLTDQEAADYMALWRWIGHIMGTPVNWMARPSMAKASMEAVMLFEMQSPSEKSAVIANNILTSQSNTPPLHASRSFLAALSYRLNGHDLSSVLQIQRPGAWYRALAAMQMFFFMLVSWSYVLLPEGWQTARNKKFLRYVREVIISSKFDGLGQETKFEFKHIPEIGKTTELGIFHRGTSHSIGALVVSISIVLGLAISSAISIAIYSHEQYRVMLA